MNPHVSSLLDELSKSPTQREDLPVAERDAWIQTAPPEDIRRLLDGLIESAELKQIQTHPRLVGVLTQLVRRQRKPEAFAVEAASGGELEGRRIVLLYKHLGDKCTCRWLLLQWLATAAFPSTLRAFTELLPAASLPDPNAVALLFSPLFQKHAYDATSLFPALLGAINRPELAPSILDLANFLARENRVPIHPAVDRRSQLEGLLRAIMHQLNCLQESGGGGESSEDLAQKMEDAVALVVSLCDALALIGHRDSAAVLRQVLDLSHRRIRTEAAAALARLGDETGVEALLGLAAEPVARLRVLSYAAELGLEDRIDPQFATDEARCEAEVALQLAQPAYFGLPPTRLETVDRRQLYWPGCDEPVDCYLFRYFYELAGSQFANIAIGGPLSHTFAADLCDVSIDDIYAAFAGWDVEHDEIYEIPSEDLTDGQNVEVRRLVRRLKDAGYERIEPLCLGFFFGRRFVVAHAQHRGKSGIAAADTEQILWYPAAGPRPLGADETLCIYKGRQLLRAFPA